MDHDDALREVERVQARERQAQEQLALAEQRLLAAEQVAAQLHVALVSAQGEASVLRVTVADLERRNLELSANAAHFREVNAGLMSSLSWRITRPLRVAKQRLRP